MNLNLNVFWTLVVVLIVAPLMALVLTFGLIGVAALVGSSVPDF